MRNAKVGWTLAPERRFLLLARTLFGASKFCSIVRAFVMAEIRIDRGAWVIVFDGTKAMVLENFGNPLFPKLRPKDRHLREDPKTSEQGSDAPGRAFNPVAPARSAMEETDWHEQAERRFMTDLARRLDAAIQAGKTDALILVAPPRALGMLRQASTQTMRRAIRGEINKDLVKLPVPEIERHLA
jgi:protein required for attachment to host cells